jgi:hypothetical protein
MGLSANQLLAVTVSARTMSVLSLAGSLFIMATFLRWEYFRKPINRLVFYASFGNVMANVATLISTSALSSPLSTLCEFQGILVQWFMAADSLWVSHENRFMKTCSSLIFSIGILHGSQCNASFLPQLQL